MITERSKTETRKQRRYKRPVRSSKKREKEAKKEKVQRMKLIKSPLLWKRKSREDSKSYLSLGQLIKLTFLRSNYNFLEIFLISSLRFPVKRLSILLTFSSQQERTHN